MIPALRAYFDTIDWIETVVRRDFSGSMMSALGAADLPLGAADLPRFIEMKSGGALSIRLSR